MQRVMLFVRSVSGLKLDILVSVVRGQLRSVKDVAILFVVCLMVLLCCADLVLNDYVLH